MWQQMTSRRQVLSQSAVGFGWLAASALLRGTSSAAAGDSPPFPFPARARRVIFMFMKGGPSQVDTFDPKPKLDADDGKELPFAKPRVQFAKTGVLLKSPWKFQQYGESGCPVSELFPHVARHVDDICFLNGVHGTNAAHGGAALKLHTGSDTFVRPGMGAWVNYGLGTENESLPGFITICPTLAHGGVNNWGAAFLPAECQGVPMGVASRPASEAAVKYIANSKLPRDAQRLQIEMLRELAGRGAADAVAATSEPLVEAQLKSFELAFRMQSELPEVQDLSGETAETLSLYGIGEPVTDDFGRQCLLARRFAEAGVRFIQVTHSDSKVQWDQHANLREGHAEKAAEVDKPIAGLLADLKRRGLLEDTLLLWGGEFGRTPVAEATANGRDHNPEGFTMWMAGGGVRGGFRYGSTDDYGYYATENAMHIHDVHATMLALLGIDHEHLTYRYAGRNFRLTDVAGKVHDAIFA
ncbi:MAG: DUF1501 domain-containing protein [Pirellulales bacterium]|jgi:hypothetical protein